MSGSCTGEEVIDREEDGGPVRGGHGESICPPGVGDLSGKGLAEGKVIVRAGDVAGKGLSGSKVTPGIP